MILDEVQSGFGRTGKWFCCDHWGVSPDIMVLDKALGGGMPIAACLGRPHVMAAWPVSHGEALHTSTFLGHPVAAAAALATIAVLQREDIVGLAARVGDGLQALLRTHLAGHPWVREIRGRGLMIGVELFDPHTQLPASLVAWRTVTGALRRGVLLLPCGAQGEVIQLTPPAVLTVAQQLCVVLALRAALDEAIA